MLLAVVLFVGMLPAITPTASAAVASGQALVNMAMKQEGKTRADLGLTGAWCARFVAWCAIKAGQADLFGLGKDPSVYGNPRSHANHFVKSGKGTVYYYKTTYKSNYKGGDNVAIVSLKNNGCSKSQISQNTKCVERTSSSFTPQAGDLICFLWADDASAYTWSHIGIVQSTKGEKVYYTDGNGTDKNGYFYGPESSTVVTDKVKSLSDKSITCFIRPNYCKHSNGYDSTGKCNSCGSEFVLTHDTNKAGIYKVKALLSTMRKYPYSGSEELKGILFVSNKVNVKYSANNANGETWMYCTYNGVSGWIKSGDLSFVSAPASEITFTGLKTPGKLSEGSSWPVAGSVTSTYAIKEVVGKLITSDGTVKQTAKATPASGATTFNIGSSPVDNNLEFGKLKTGYYYYTITATDVRGESKTWTSGTFQVGTPTQSTCAKPVITPADAEGGKTVTITCATSGATIKWSCAGKSGSGKSPQVIEGVSADTIVTATASKSGMKDSAEARTTVYVAQCVEPVIKAGVLTENGLQVVITSEGNHTIMYSLDGGSFQKYTDPFYVKATTNVRAYAVMNGFGNSETVTETVTLVAPAAPKVRLVSTAQHIASGRPITVMWDKDGNVTSYKVDVYYEDEIVETKYLTTTSHTFASGAQGNYKVLVTASNVAGSSAAAESPIITAHAPSIVQFYHEDGTLLSEQQVDYGESAVAPESIPNKEGHTFIGWDKNLSNITQDTTIWAKFRINTYTVRFYAYNGTELLGTQQITYGSGIHSEEMEQRLKLDIGYAFVGWHIRDAASNSRMNLDFIDCDMSLVATQQWEVRDLPIVVNVVGTPERNADCTGYDVELSLTCAPASVIGGNTQKAKVIVALKTKDNQTLGMAVEMVNLTEDEQKLSRTIFVSYDGSYLADQVEITIIGIDGNDRTGGQLARTVYAVPEVTENWTEWSTEEPPEGVVYETKVQYQYRDSSRQTTMKESSSSVAPAMSGWEVVGDPIERWGAWSAWSDSKITKTDTRNVEKSKPIQETPEYKEYRYGRWSNGSANSYCKAAGKYYSGGSSWKEQYTSWSKTRYKKVADSIFFCSGFTSNDGHTHVAFSDKDGDNWYTYSKDGKYSKSTRWFWEETRTVPATYKYQYRYQDKIFTHTYQKWTTGEWSAWGDTVYTPHSAENSRREVNERTVYRYITNDLTVTELDENKRTEEYAFEGALTGSRVGDYAGKLGTVLVYKQVNSDPTEPQMESISQIEIGEGNSYSFSLRPKEMPTTATGDFIVALALQGSSNVVNIGKIAAPAEQLKVTFCDYDGNVLEEQLVSAGEAVQASAAPVREGYRFVCWNNDLTCANRDMSVFPVYVAEEYSVVFVDHENEIVELKTDYVYGDALLTPDTPSCEGMNFIGWQITYNSTGETKILESVSAASEDVVGESLEVTDDMIVTAVWEPIEYTVSFYNYDGSVLQEQTVAHGCAATLPDAIAAPEGMVFLGWSTDVQWWDVTEDMGVTPIVVYEETTAAPAADEFEYIGLMEDIELMSEDGAVIYYTLDGSDPEPGQEGTYVYSEPIHVETDTVIRAMAIKENKNVSEIVEVSFWYMDGMEDYPVDDTLLVGNYNIQVEPNATVQLQMNIENNPGLVAYMFFVDANTNVFSIPTNVETGETDCTVGSICSNGDLLIGDYEEGLGWPVLWYGMETAEGNGNLCNIVLQVSEEAEAGTYPITVRYSPANTFDADYITQEIPGLSAGFSGASEFKMGDVDGDGMVTNKDVVLTARWIIGAVKIAEERQFLIDVNNDGSKTMADVLHMARYVVGLEHVLGGLG